MKKLRLKKINLSEYWAAIALLIFSMLCFPTGAALAKKLFILFDAQGTAALRLFFSALIMAAVFRPWRGKLTPKDAKRIIVYGAAMGCMNLFFYMALKTVPLGIVVALEFTGPLSVSLLASKNRLDFLWALLASAGILLFTPLDGVSTLDPLGMLYALTAGTFWAIYIIYGQKAGSNVQGPRATALGIIAASCIVVPIGGTQVDISLLATVPVLTLALAIAALSSALPYSLEMFALQRLPQKSFGIFMSLEPAFAALIGLIVLGEHLNLREYAAICFVVLASAGSATFSKKSAVRQEIQS